MWRIAAVILVVLTSTRARAQEDVSATRALGMADALRAAGVGSAGIHLNPSGLTLLRSYTVEGAFLFGGADSARNVDVSIADSTNPFVAAGVYFDYINADAKDAMGVKIADRTGWEAGLAVAAPIGDWLSIGFTPKYMSIDEAVCGSGALQCGKAEGFTIDAGATARPVSFLNVGVVGTNLAEVGSTHAPRTLGLGALVSPISSLAVGFDAVFDFDTSRLLTAGMRDQVSESYHLGGEYMFGQRLALRGGYVWDGATNPSRSYASYGASLVTPQVALDFGGRTQVDGPGGTSTFFGVSLRMFLPHVQ
jgi:hypothetical protein